MDNEERIIEQKKEKFKKLFNNPYKIIFGIILAIALIVRIYFFNIAKDQAHWWDTLAYGSIAKNMIYHLWDNNHFLLHETIIRPPLLPWIWSLLIKVGIQDYGSLIILGIIPSLLSVWLIYLIVKELYDEKVGLIASFICAVSWIHLFYSVRIMTDIPSLFFSLLSIYFFVKSYENLKTKEFALSVASLAIAVMLRYSFAVIAFVYIIFLAIIYKHHFLKKKEFWVGGSVGAIPLILFFIMNLIKFGSILPAGSEYASSAAAKTGFAYYVLNFIPYILNNVYNILFILGIIIILWELVIGYDSINKIKKLRSHLFGILFIVLNLGFYVLIIKAAEDRYLMSLFPVMFLSIGIFLVFIFNIVKNYSKPVGYIVILALLLIGAHAQLTFADAIIKNKVDSFKPMKDAFVWIGENTPKDAIISGDWADPYAIFYSERRLSQIPEDLNFSGYNLTADYITLTRVHEPTVPLINYVNEKVSEGSLEIANAFFFDVAKTEPAVIVYKVNKDKINQ